MCFDSWGRKEFDVTEQLNRTEQNDKKKVKKLFVWLFYICIPFMVKCLFSYY